MATTMSPKARQPFGELGASQLQRLSAAKNVQNSLTELLASQKPAFTFKPSGTGAAKRPMTPTIFEVDDDDFDSENVDPSLVSSKRSKGLDGSAVKKSATFDFNFARPSRFSLTPSASALTSQSSHVTPINPLLSPSKPAATPLEQAMSAPAGRSPKSRRIGVLSRRKLAQSSPFRRIDPPMFGAPKGVVAAGSPFSLDAALKGTLSTYKTPAPQHAATIRESMPKGWFFAIHEDTPEEEAQNLMEHSAGTLDISSDDEAGRSKTDDRGKENIPPADYTAPARAKRAVNPDFMTDIRAPLESLHAEHYYGPGLDQTSVAVVPDDKDEDYTADAQSVAQQQDVVAAADAPAPAAAAAEADEGKDFVVSEDATATGAQ